MWNAWERSENESRVLGGEKLKYRHHVDERIIGKQVLEK
jgi:hypothetical protein